MLPAVCAAQALVPGNTPGTANVLERVEYLRDPSGKLTLKDLQRPSADEAFKAYKRKYFFASDPEAVHWFRFDIQAAPDAPYRATLYFTDARLKKATLFRQVIAANADVFRYDPSLAADNTVTKQGGIGLPIALQAGTKRTIYLSLQGADISGSLELWEPAALTAFLKQDALWYYTLLAVLALVFGFGAYLAYSAKKAGGVILAVAALAYAFYLSLFHIAFAPPAWLGTLNLTLFVGAIFSASALRVAIQPLMGEGAVPFLGWWSIVLSCAIVVAAVLSAVMPAPAILFSYVLTAALVIASLFGVIVLLTLKTVPAYRLAALLAFSFAVCIALVPNVPMDLSFLEPAISLFTVATLLASALYMFIPWTSFGANVSGEDDQYFQQAAQDTEKLSTFPDILKAEAPLPQMEQATYEPSLKSAAKMPNDTVSKETDVTAGIEAAAKQPDALDDMTGVFNAVTIEALGQKTIAQVKRYHRSHTAIMLRIDDYEELFTSLGQPTSDRAVKLLAVTSMRDLRESDALGRIRADTFIALLAETDLPGAYVALNRMKHNLFERTLPTRAGMRKLSVTFAASMVDENDMEFEDIVHRLEANLSSDLPSVGSDGAAATRAAE